MTWNCAPQRSPANSMPTYAAPPPVGVLRLCWAHMGIRLVDWAIRHHGPADVERWLSVAEQGYEL